MLDRIKKIGIKDLLLWIILIVTFCTTLFSVLTFGKAHMHSDCATSKLLADSILSNHSLFPSTWNYTNGDVWLLDPQLFYLIVHIFVKDVVLARLLATYLMEICFVICLYYFSKKIFKDNSYLLMAVISFLFIGGTQCRDMLLYQGAYLMQLSLFVLSVSLFWQLIQLKSKKNIILYFIIVCLWTIGGTRVLAEYALPLVAAYTLFVFSEAKVEKDIYNRTQLKNYIFAVAPIVIGYILYLIVASSHNMNYSTTSGFLMPGKLDAIGKNIIVVLKNLFVDFGYTGNCSVFSIVGLRNCVSIVMCILICIIFPVMQGLRLSQEKKEVRFFYYFGLSHNAVLLMVCILTSKLLDYWLLSTIFVFVLISARYIYSVLFENHNIYRSIWIFLFVAATLIQGLFLAHSSENWHELYDSHMRIANELTSRNLTKGYASLWNSYTNELYSNGKLRMGGVYFSEQVTARYALVDSTTFENTSDNSFLLMDSSEASKYADYAWDYLGTPIEDFEIENVYTFDEETHSYHKDNVLVFVYDHDVAEDLNNGFHDDKVTVHEMKFNWMGTERATEDGIEAVLEQGGVLTCFNPIDPGKYVITYHGEALKNAGIEISSKHTPKAVEATVLSINDDEIQCEVNISDYVDDLKLSVFNKSNSTVIFNDIVLEEMK